MKRLLHRGKFIIVTMALASGLASSIAVAPVAHAATHPAAAISAPIQPGPQYEPPDPC